MAKGSLLLLTETRSLASSDQVVRVMRQEMWRLYPSLQVCLCSSCNVLHTFGVNSLGSHIVKVSAQARHVNTLSRRSP